MGQRESKERIGFYMLQSPWLSPKQPLVTVLGYISPYLVSVVQSLSLNQGQLEQCAVAMEM